MTATTDRRVTVGRVAGLFGIRGWVKVYSHTRPPEAILDYRPWLIEIGGAWRPFEIAEGQMHGKGIIARLDGIADRDQAAALVGATIAVALDQLPAATENEYYWAELEGLRVINLAGQELGRVSHLFETGANDVMVVQGERERLLPFSKPVIQRVDIAGGVIHVDWDAED
ncbi:MAG: ribosome maturation factor RimM [Gammaproteobacteria bacterium]|nr:ribosome maturation factor RimM [Gammaproteobacteria bacterium]